MPTFSTVLIGEVRARERDRQARGVATGVRRLHRARRSRRGGEAWARSGRDDAGGSAEAERGGCARTVIGRLARTQPKGDSSIPRRAEGTRSHVADGRRYGKRLHLRGRQGSGSCRAHSGSSEARLSGTPIRLPMT